MYFGRLIALQAWLLTQYMLSIWLVNVFRCSARSLRILLMAGFNANWRFIQVATCTAATAPFSAQMGHISPSITGHRHIEACLRLEEIC